MSASELSPPDATASEPDDDELEIVDNGVAFTTRPEVVLQSTQLLLLILAALYVARPIVLPVVLAIILKLLLQPGVRRLERLHIPRAIAALTMIIALFVLLVSTGTALSGPAHEWADQLPGALPRLTQRLSFISTPIESVQRFLEHAEMYLRVTTTEGSVPVVTAVSSGLSDFLFAGTAGFASGLFTTVLVLFFLLMSGDLFLRRLVEILPRFRDKRTAVQISKQIESDVTAYLITVTIMNISVGIATSLAMWAIGLGNPVLWGVIAFLLNYVPVMGPIISLVLLLLAGMLTMEPLWRAFLPVSLFLLIHLTEGQFITPLLVARRFTLNPVVVVISLIFWYWMWGVPGAVLAVPVLGITKIICDSVRPWASIGHLIEG